MARSAAGTGGVEGVHERQRTVTRSSRLPQERSSFDEDDNSVQGRTHVAEQDVAEQEVEEEVTDLDLSSTTLSKGVQRTSAPAQTNYSENKRSPRAGKGLHDERGTGAGESIEGKSTDQSQFVRFQDLDVTEVFTESELI